MQHGQHVLLVFLAFMLSSTGSLLPARTWNMPSTQGVAARSQSDNLSINEFAADNDSILCDPDDPDPAGCWEDWFEIYNPSDHSVNLQGMYLSDNLNNLTKFRIAAPLSVPAGGFLLFWADDETAQGPNHTSFKLSASGESLALVATDGVTVIDQYSFGPQLTDISEGRCPDGMDTWRFFGAPTPNSANGDCAQPPIITQTTHAPQAPSTNEAVTVDTIILDEGDGLLATLFYSTGGPFTGVPMVSSNLHHFQATIPPQPGTTWVAYYVSATDGDGMIATDPASAPAVTFVYQVTPPPRCATPGGPSVCTVFLPMVRRPHYHTIALPKGINSGGPAISLADGKRFEKDQPYSGTNGAGYIGGQAIESNLSGEPIDGTESDQLYRTGRSGVSAYRFDVPNGHYVVELHLAEIRQHGSGIRVFDVTIENRSVLRSLDLYALAQHDYATRFRFAADVQDGQLDVSFSATTGEPLVSAIWVEQRAPDNQSPAAPTTLHVVGGYRQAIVRWSQVEEDDVAGYRVYRASSQAGPFQMVTTEPVRLARFFDDAVTVGRSYCYTASAVDLFGNESPRSTIACAAVVDDDASTLPVFDLAISAEDLHALAVDPFAEVEVPGTLTSEDQQFDVIAEYRGRTTQGSNKKGWKVVAPQAIPYSQQKTLLLNGAGYDPAMIREKVAYDLFDAIGIQPLQTSFVHLGLNHQFIGVFTQVENPDPEFLRRTGRDPDGDVFKCLNDVDLQPHCTNEIEEGRGMEDLVTFGAVVNRTPDVEFASTIAEVLDVRAFLDYQAIKVVTADVDCAHQFLLYHDSGDGRWQVLPWDNNVAFHQAQMPVDDGTAEHPAYQGHVNTLLTRVLRVPQYRRYFGERLLDLIQGLFSESNMDDRFDAAKTEIWFDAERDVWKVFREDNDAFAMSFSHLHGFVDRRIAYLESAVPAYMPAQNRFIGLNEVMAKNTSTIVDPADGQAEPWFEIVNTGLDPVDIGGLFLTNSLGNPTKYRIPATTLLPALASLLFWADGEPNQGPGHVNFWLPGSGSQVHLFDRDGSTKLDTVTYPNLPANVSLGRFPDQSGQWLQLRQPTPGRLNRLMAPRISELDQTPRFPQAGDVVTVTAVITDDGSVGYASVIYGAGQPVTLTPMADDGNHGDGAANDGRYGAQIPALSQGTVVRYYLSATDDYGRTMLDPPAAPVLTHSYRVGFQPPTIAISEFMAANDTTLEDPDEPGEYPDWIELSNTGVEPINLNGYFLTDDLQQSQAFRIGADLIVPPGDTVVFFADDDPEQGPRHTTFKLRAEGEAVGLLDRDGVTPIDTVVFPAQTPDVAYGQCPATMGQWGFFYVPTPGRANACGRRYLPAVNGQ